jgi:hypothetical protein
MTSHRITDVSAAAAFVLAGNATFTLVSRKTGIRFTYKVRQPEEGKPHFVAVLTGPENSTDFTYLGVIRPGPSFARTAKSKIGPDAASCKAFDWFARQLLSRGQMPEAVELWHEGKCGRCGRKLTVPSSIETGLGPECAGRFKAEAA